MERGMGAVAGCRSFTGSLFALVAASVCACGGGMSESKSPGEQNAEDLKTELIPRAAYDLGCAPEKLTAKCIDPPCRTAGVSGCGKQATYLFGTLGRWIMNSTLEGSTNAVAAQPGEATSKPASTPMPNVHPQVWEVVVGDKEDLAACKAAASALLGDLDCKGEQCRAALGLHEVFSRQCRASGAAVDKVNRAVATWKEEAPGPSASNTCYQRLLKAVKDGAVAAKYKKTCLDDREPGNVERMMLQAAPAQE